MAEDLAALRAQLEAIRSAIRMGAVEVSYAGRSIRYRSIAALRQVAADIEKLIAADPNAAADEVRSPSVRRVRIFHCRR